MELFWYGYISIVKFVIIVNIICCFITVTINQNNIFWYTLVNKLTSVYRELIMAWNTFM